ncbi:ADAM 17-like protease isoform X2 [Pecten maximus]|uniref:ADAM 17-like protease isoform X2 n=1 Tax=Pecten maximus TaxID=6579 RepID=UPI0014590C23|nr:ADAM 17-like protease isoform X2 [Pecten maximus]
MDYIYSCRFPYLYSLLILLLFVFEVPSSQYEEFTGDELTASLHHFEVLHFLDVKHRTKRYVDPEKTEDFHQVWITAFGKQFHLSMKKSAILSHDFHTTLIYRDGSSKDVLSSSYDFYSGTLHGEKDTQANVYWEDGVLTASIVTADEVYFVEPARRYVPTAHNHTLIVYRKSDLIVTQDPWDGVMRNAKTSCKYQTNATVSQEEKGPIKDRVKRAVDFGNRKYCRIILVADHYFYENIGHRSIIATQNYMIGVLDRVNTIYQATRWPDNSGVTGLGFEISKITIHLEPSEGDHYNQANRKTNMEDTLDVFSAEFFLNDACLVHLFTYTAFQHGLGLAYIASWRSRDFGGICSSTDYDLKIAGNTGLTSLRNRAGKTVLTLQSTITTAHEFGHNWGSGHDNADSSECKDFYIMYPTSQEGAYSNNVIFSPCSRRSIYKVLEVKGKECFKEKNPYFAYCGNGRVDSGEECDSGTRTDSCCTDKCLLTPGSDCSPYNKACCSHCKLAVAGTVCLQTVDDNFDCKGSSQCNGFQYDCPPPGKKADNTSCQDAGKCVDGHCVGFCQQMGMIPCVCSPESGLACYRCCKAARDSKCVSFTELLDNGRTCYKGYCQAGVCIKSPSPINKFWNALTSRVIDSFGTFMRNNIVFFITLFTAILWLPSVLIFEYFENKKKKEDDFLIKKQVNKHMREKVDILPEGSEKQSSIRHIGSLSVSDLRSSRTRDSEDTGHRTSNQISDRRLEDAGHPSTLFKSGSQPLYTDSQKLSTLPQSWKPGGYDRKPQRIPLTVDNLSDQRPDRRDAPRHINNLSSQPRKYPSNAELQGRVYTLPYSVRPPVDRYTGYGTENYNKASTLPLPVRGVRTDNGQKPNNNDRYTFDNGPGSMQPVGHSLSNQPPMTFKPTALRMYDANSSHLVNPLPSGDDGQHFVPISHRSSDTDYESTPRNPPHSYYYHENPYEEPANVSQTSRGHDGKGQPISYEKLSSNYGPPISTENLSRPRQATSNEHLTGNRGNHYHDNRYSNLGYDGDSMTETMI